MKIIIGVCGIGHGHCLRQIEIASRLKSLGHEIIIFGSNSSVSFFEERGYNVERVWGPMFMYDKDKLSVLRFVRDNYKKCFLGLFRDIWVFTKIFFQRKDIMCFISDYDSISARFSYRLHKPLILIGQQNKFRYSEFNQIGSLSYLEEKTRLELFFPKFVKNFILSFYKIHIADQKNVEVMNIFVSDIMKFYKEKQVQKSKKIVVYLSNFLGMRIKQSYHELYNIFNKFPEYNFNIYTKEKIDFAQKVASNVTFLGIDIESFHADLAGAQGIIATAGHSLIGESLYYQIPFFAIPIVTFDQFYCGKYIMDNGLGYSSEYIDEQNLGYFLSNLNIFLTNIKDNKELNVVEGSLEKIVSYINDEQWEA